MISEPRKELLRIQRKLYRINKHIIDASIFVKERDFERYERRYKKAIADFREIVSHDEMLRAVAKADLIYIGDYHTSNQSQRSFLRILKAVARSEVRSPKSEVGKKKSEVRSPKSETYIEDEEVPNFIIGMELIHTRHQKILDDFLKGRLTEESFLRKISLRQHWVFDLWPNFKPLFDFAKYHHIKVFGIDAAPMKAALKERDEATGKLVARLLLENPDKKVFVLIGDLHLAPEHLPAEVEKALFSPKSEVGRKKSEVVGPKSLAQESKSSRLRTSNFELRTLILYQNSDAIYWKLAEMGQEEQVEVVKIDDKRYCRLHTPPIVVQQSYINWLEHEEGEIDYADAKHSFLTLVDRITEFFDIDLGKYRDMVDVFTCGDLSFLKALKESGKFTGAELKAIKKQIAASESYYVAKRRFVYLANLSINHAAEEAAHFIKHICSGLEKPRNLIDAFYANILHEALAFCSSKLINSRRKAAHEKEFLALVKYLRSIGVSRKRRPEYDAARLALNYLKWEREGKPYKFRKIFIQDPQIFFAVTHALGYMLGDIMFYGLMKGRLDKEMIRGMFYDKWREVGRPFEMYMELKKRLRGVKIPKRM